MSKDKLATPWTNANSLVEATSIALKVVLLHRVLMCCLANIEVRYEKSVAADVGASSVA